MNTQTSFDPVIAMELFFDRLTKLQEVLERIAVALEQIEISERD